MQKNSLFLAKMNFLPISVVAKSYFSKQNEIFTPEKLYPLSGTCIQANGLSKIKSGTNTGPILTKAG